MAPNNDGIVVRGGPDASLKPQLDSKVVGIRALRASLENQKYISAHLYNTQLEGKTIFADQNTSFGYFSSTVRLYWSSIKHRLEPDSQDFIDELQQLLFAKTQGVECVLDLFTNETRQALRNESSEALQSLAIILEDIYQNLAHSWSTRNSGKSYITRQLITGPSQQLGSWLMALDGTDPALMTLASRLYRRGVLNLVSKPVASSDKRKRGDDDDDEDEVQDHKRRLTGTTFHSTRHRLDLADQDFQIKLDMLCNPSVTKEDFRDLLYKGVSIWKKDTVFDHVWAVVCIFFHRIDPKYTEIDYFDLQAAHFVNLHTTSDVILPHFSEGLADILPSDPDDILARLGLFLAELYNHQFRAEDTLQQIKEHLRVIPESERAMHQYALDELYEVRLRERTGFVPRRLENSTNGQRIPPVPHSPPPPSPPPHPALPTIEESREESEPPRGRSRRPRRLCRKPMPPSPPAPVEANEEPVEPAPVEQPVLLANTSQYRGANRPFLEDSGSDSSPPRLHGSDDESSPPPPPPPPPAALITEPTSAEEPTDTADDAGAAEQEQQPTIIAGSSTIDDLIDAAQASSPPVATVPTTHHDAINSADDLPDYEDDNLHAEATTSGYGNRGVDDLPDYEDEDDATAGFYAHDEAEEGSYYHRETSADWVAEEGKERHEEGYGGEDEQEGYAREEEQEQQGVVLDYDDYDDEEVVFSYGPQGGFQRL